MIAKQQSPCTVVMTRMLTNAADDYYTVELRLSGNRVVVVEMSAEQFAAALTSKVTDAVAYEYTRRVRAAADPQTVLALVEEVERLRRSDSELQAVMISVDKWFSEDDPVLAENPATRAAKLRAEMVRMDGELRDKIDRLSLLQARVAELEKNQ